MSLTFKVVTLTLVVAVASTAMTDLSKLIKNGRIKQGGKCSYSYLIRYVARLTELLDVN